MYNQKVEKTFEEKVQFLVNKTRAIYTKLDGPKPSKLSHNEVRKALQSVIARTDEATLNL